MGKSVSLGGVVAGGLLGGAGGALAGGLFGKKGGSSAPMMGGQQSRMDMLVNSGGAPLLMNIALGANIDDTLASFLNVDKEKMLYFMAHPELEREAMDHGFTKDSLNQIRQLQGQLGAIQKDTNLKNQTLQNLATDFPNIMAQKVPQYASLMDDATKQMMNQALGQVGAKFASGGMLSSGAMAQAAADAGAQLGMQRLEYGTNLAMQDWQNQYNNASALQSFQQKMLGQGAMNGFNAVQNALANNQQINLANFNAQARQNELNQQGQQQMWQGIGQLGGTAIGAMIGGPFGASAGSQLGGMATGGMSGGANRLNTSFVPMPPPASSSQYRPYGVSGY